MMAGNPTNWWSMMANAGTVHPPHHHSSSSSSPSYQLSPPSSSSHHFYAPSDSMPENPAQDFPRSWSQLLLGGAENEKFGMSPFQYKRMVQETWEDQIINGNNNNNNNNPSSSSSSTAPVVDVIKHEDHFPQIGHLYGHNHHPPPPLLPLVLENDHHHQYFQQTAAAAAAAPPRPLPHHHHHQEFASSSSSPRSCVTTAFRDSAGNNNNNNNVLIFSGHRSCPKPPEAIVNTHHSSQCNSTSTSSGGAPKKARVHQSSTQSSLKVRKEKLGDRITALHQLVSPFGKTDTASVLSEAIGYIRFLHTQIQALSSPYLGNASAGSMAHTHQQSVTEKGGGDLRSRGLCLVPLSCTDQHVGVGSDINGGAEYWAPALGGGF
ncbi:PREDICTED: transcription factor bHLH68-like isoform X2 [Ipomoea nil]|uniref:transcription factor bHLH68-like isoform X2 n=1 Tax=Ipomoea nil TaxID=35883 RepID=UPI000900BB20|nr:PREDICTED: transcription factor bHLH68-like isoform X2 [Ipomoea nil]